MFHAVTLLTIVAVAFNWFHWGRYPDQPWIYGAPGGWPKIAQGASSTGLVLTAVLVALKCLRVEVFFYYFFGLQIIVSLYSIWRRSRQGAGKGVAG